MEASRLQRFAITWWEQVALFWIPGGVKGGRCSSLVKAQWEVTRSCYRRVTCGSRSSLFTISVIPSSSPTLFTLHNMCPVYIDTHVSQICMYTIQPPHHHHVQWHLQWHRSARVVVVASPISLNLTPALPLSARIQPLYHQLISTLDACCVGRDYYIGV